MSRFRRFAHSLVSGYVLLGANTLYTLASVPLALKYLSIEEFGLWALASSIAQYVGLIDMGMTGTSRILVDYKDRKDDGNYGSVIQTFWLVGLVQALLIAALGIGLPFALAPLLHIHLTQQREFVFLVMGQCALLAGGFLTRISILLLGAHQRYDVINYSKTGIFAVYFVVLWAALASNQGVYSTLWAQSIGWILDAFISISLVVKLKLLPAQGCWGRPTWDRFRELFNFGRDVFLIALGFQMLSASQTLILTRVLGLEIAATWYACTRSYTVVSQLVFRIFEFSAPALAEMIVRGEKDLLCQRFRSLVILSASLSVWAGTIFAVCNQPFIQLWIRGKFSWSHLNDALLAIWLVIQVVARCHLGLVGQTKQFRFVRYLYVVEGAFFVIVSLLLLRRGGVAGMMLVSIAGSLLFSSVYGTWRTSNYFHLPWKTIWLHWSLPALRLALALAPLAAVVSWLSRPLALQAQLALCAGATALAGAPLFLRFGLDHNLQRELLERTPARLRPLLYSLGRKMWLPAAAK